VKGKFHFTHPKAQSTPQTFYTFGSCGGGDIGYGGTPYALCSG